MYLPARFEAEDRETTLALIDEHPFATIVAVDAGRPVVNHLPLFLERAEGGAKLVGHMSRKNGLWRLLEGVGEATAIFHGPHAYVTPRWYTEHDVPTWNYAVVHVSGPVRLVEDYKRLVRILTRLTDKFEGGAPEPWRFSLPDDLKGEGVLERAIVGFEIEMRDVVCKLKLSQNRVAVDRAGVVKGLEERGDDESRKVAALMRKLT